MKKITCKLIKVNAFQLKLLFFLFIIYRPEFLIKYGTINVLINISRILITIILAINYIYRGKFDKTLLATITIFGSYGILCLIKNTWDFNVLIEFTLIVDIYIFAYIYIAKHTKDVYCALSVMLLLYGVCNTITILVGCRNESLFLGFDNDISMRIIPLLGVLLYLSVLVHEKNVTLDYMICLIFLLDFLLTWAVAGIIGFLLMYVLVFSEKLFHRRKSLVFIGASFIMWIFLYIVKIQDALSFIVVRFLGKDITLAYRTYIWESVIEAIKKSPLIGYGKWANSEVYYDIVYPIYYASINPHNLWLHVIASAGIVGFVLFVAFLIYSFRKADKNVDFIGNKMLLGAFGGYLLCGMFSSYYGIEYLTFILAIASFEDKLECIKWNNKR